MDPKNEAKRKLADFLMTLPPEDRLGTLKEMVRRARVINTNSEAKAKQQETTSFNSKIDTTRHERVAKQMALAQQEFLRLRALPSLADCSDAHLKAMSRSYMGGSTEAEMDRELARGR